MERLEYEKMARVEDIHWWFVARRHIILRLYEQFCHRQHSTEAGVSKICDIGCGMGVMLNQLSVYGDIYGMDMEPFAVEYCRSLVEDKLQLSKDEAARHIVQGVLPDNIPFDTRFSSVFALDVLEHIDDDRRTVQVISSILDNTGYAVITVPALMSLWSYNDVFVHHKRRYSKEQLVKLFSDNGFKVLKCSYLNHKLFPAIWLVRKIKNLLKIEKDDLNDSAKDTITNRIFNRIFSSEIKTLMKRDYSYGVSLVLIAQKVTDGG